MEILSTTRDFVLGADQITYFEVTRVTYEDNSYNETSALVGPAAALTNDQADKIEGIMRTLASDSYRVSRTRSILSEANDVGADIFTITAVSPLKVIQDRYQAALLEPGWTIDDGTGFVPIVFTVNGQGVLRYNVNGTGPKNAKMYGAVIRLNNYPASPTDTDFFLSKNGSRYFSLPNRNVIIKKP